VKPDEQHPVSRSTGSQSDSKPLEGLRLDVGHPRPASSRDRTPAAPGKTYPRPPRPRWFNVWNRVVVDLSTHDAGGITGLDVELARKLNDIAD
jgi:hypothetical protein